MSNYIVNSLSRVLEKYLIDFSKSDLSVSLLSSHAELRNVKINPLAVQQVAGYSLELQEGTVDHIRVSYSVVNIKTRPVVISINCVELRLQEKPAGADASDQTGAAAGVIDSSVDSAGNAANAGTVGGGDDDDFNEDSLYVRERRNKDEYPVVIQGWLGKRGRWTKQRRWFVLRGKKAHGQTSSATGKLRYLLSEDEDASQLRGEIDLATVEDVRVPNADEPLFELVTATRTWPLLPGDLVERDRWLQALNSIGVGGVTLDRTVRSLTSSDLSRRNSFQVQQQQHHGVNVRKHYGLTEKLMDGITVEIKELKVSLQTLGDSAANTGGSSPSGSRSAGMLDTPPLLQLTLQGLKFESVNESWKVVNLHECRKFSKQFPNDIYVFRHLYMLCNVLVLPHTPSSGAAGAAAAPSSNASQPLGHEAKSIVLSENCPVQVRILRRKRPGMSSAAAAAADAAGTSNESPVTGMETTIEFPDMEAHLKVSEVSHVLHMFHGLMQWYSRIEWGSDTPAHTITAMLFNQLKFVIVPDHRPPTLSPGFRQLGLELSRLRIGLISPEGTLEYVKQILLGELRVLDVELGDELISITAPWTHATASADGGSSEPSDRAGNAQQHSTPSKSCCHPSSQQESPSQHERVVHIEGVRDYKSKWHRSSTTDFDMPIPLHDNDNSVPHSWSRWTLNPHSDALNEHKEYTHSDALNEHKESSVELAPAIRAPSVMLILRSKLRKDAAYLEGSHAHTWHHRLAGRLGRCSARWFTSLPCYATFNAMLDSITEFNAKLAFTRELLNSSGENASSLPANEDENMDSGAADTWSCDLHLDEVVASVVESRHDTVLQEPGQESAPRIATQISVSDCHLQLRSTTPNEREQTLRKQTATGTMSDEIDNTSTLGPIPDPQVVSSVEDRAPRQRRLRNVKMAMKRAAGKLLGAKFTENEVRGSIHAMTHEQQTLTEASAGGDAAFIATREASQSMDTTGVWQPRQIDPALFDRIWLHGCVGSASVEVLRPPHYDVRPSDATGGHHARTLSTLAKDSDSLDARVKREQILVIKQVKADGEVAVRRKGRVWDMERSIARLQAQEVVVQWEMQNALFTSSKFDECYHALWSAYARGEVPRTAAATAALAATISEASPATSAGRQSKQPHPAVHILPGSVIAHLDRLRVFYRSSGDDESTAVPAEGLLAIDVADTEILRLLGAHDGPSPLRSTESGISDAHDRIFFRLAQQPQAQSGAASRYGARRRSSHQTYRGRSSTHGAAKRRSTGASVASRASIESAIDRDDIYILEVLTTRELVWSADAGHWVWAPVVREFSSSMRDLSVNSTLLNSALVPLSNEIGQLSTALWTRERSSQTELDGPALQANPYARDTYYAKPSSSNMAMADAKNDVGSGSSDGLGIADGSGETENKVMQESLEAANAEIQRLREQNMQLAEALRAAQAHASAASPRPHGDSVIV